MRFGGTALLGLLAVVSPGVVLAQTADLSRLTCGHLVDLPGAEGERLIVWLHGYYAGAAQRAGLDGRQFEAATAAVRQTCEGNRTLPLIGAEARGLFLGTTIGAAQPAASAAPALEARPSRAPGRPTPLPAR